MPINIANVDLSQSFNEWRITTNQIIESLKTQVVLKEDNVDEQPLNPFDIDSVITTVTPKDNVLVSNDTVVLDDNTKIINFKNGQILRLYGAHPNIGTTSIAIPKPSTPVCTKAPGLDGGASSFSYKVVMFDVITGKYSLPSNAATVSGINVSFFNAKNNIALQIKRASLNYGALVYRQISGGGINTFTYNLIAVLGPQDLKSSTAIWVDYYTFDYTSGSKKNSRNEYTSSSGIIHFPVTEPTAASKGWVDAEIAFVNPTENTIRFTETFSFESKVTIVQNDTSLITSAIAERYYAGFKSLLIREKTYFISNIEIPPGFTVYGRGDKSVLKKLPWSSANGNKMINTIGGVSTSDFSLSNLTIDGNMQNQYLVSENADDYANYAVQLKGTNIQMDNLKITNVIGGGLDSTGSNNFTFNSSEISNGGMTDRYSYSPLLITNSSEVVVSGNIFKNFSSAIDASSVIVGTIIGNIVQSCGTGILTYASAYLNSSQNIILGAGGEYISGPDAYDSTYDSVNINLELNTPFMSDFYVYQENNEPYNLTSYGGNISYKIDKLRKNSGVEELYGEVLIGGVNPIINVPGTNLANGEFKFSLTEASVTALKTVYSYTTLKNIDSNHVGLVYRAFCENWPPVANLAVSAGVRSGNQYTVVLTNYNGASLAIGTYVKLNSHGGTFSNSASLNDSIGTIVDINTTSGICTIQYPINISSSGSGGFISPQNKFVLAKGRIL